MILFKLKKKYAKTYIIFQENLEMDPEDKWFIDVNNVNKAGEIKNSSTIIRKDMQNWLNGYLRNGWEIFEDEKKEEK